MRSNRYKKTEKFDGLQYSPELIRQYEDPEYAKAADEYARQAQAEKQQAARSSSERSTGSRVGQSQGGRSQKRKKKYRIRKRTIFRNILVLVVLIALMGTGAFFLLTRNFEQVDTTDSNFAIDAQVAEELSGYRNIAILGSDARADEGYEGSRTDAIIIMSIKKSTGQVRLISVMRDSYLQMEYFDGTTVLDKITHAYHYLGGVNTCASLNQSLDLNIDEYVVFNWKAVADAVDCLGGIEVNVQESEISDMNHWGPDTAENVGGDYTEITQSGTQTLDGVQATTYCRIRKTSGGDEGRGQRYKKVMAAVMKKAMTQPWKLAELSSTVFPNIQTNMSQTELFTAVLGAPRYEIETSISWPENYYSGLLWDVSYVVPLTLESEVAALHEKAFDQEDYTVSDTCRQISQNIIYDTGLE